jgi:hypothetical protein
MQPGEWSKSDTVMRYLEQFRLLEQLRQPICLSYPTIVFWVSKLGFDFRDELKTKGNQKP